MSDTQILVQLAHALEAFKQDTGKEPTLVVVSSEIFAKIMPCLENVKHDKNYSKGMFGNVEIRSDFLIQDSSMIGTRPPEWDDQFPPHEFLPVVLSPFEPLHKKKKRYIKETVKDLADRIKAKYFRK